MTRTKLFDLEVERLGDSMLSQMAKLANVDTKDAFFTYNVDTLHIASVAGDQLTFARSLDIPLLKGSDILAVIQPEIQRREKGRASIRELLLKRRNTVTDADVDAAWQEVEEKRLTPRVVAPRGLRIATSA